MTVAPLREQNDGEMPPHNHELEMAVLAALLAGPGQIATVLGRLRPEHFSDDGHAAIYAEMCERKGDDRPADLVSLAGRFKNTGELDHLGGEGFLTALIPYGDARAPYLDGWAGELVDLAKRRFAIRVFRDGLDAMQYGENDVDACIGGFEMELAGMVGQGVARPDASISDAIREGAETASAAMKSGGIAGVPLGFTDFDRKTGGLMPKSLTILGGRPSMGKSTLAVNAALNAARAGRKTLVFVTEQSRAEIGLMVNARESGVSAHRMRTAKAKLTDVSAAIALAKEIEDVPLLIYERASLTVAEIRGAVLRHQPELVIVDHLQCIVAVDQSDRYRSDVERFTAISGALKAAAMASGAAFLVLCQLNRQVEQRDNKRPQLSDLRETGAIEQDADIVLLMYREEYYVQRGNMTVTPDREADIRNMAEVNIVKNRMGPIGEVHLHFDAERSLFANLDQHQSGIEGL